LRYCAELRDVERDDDERCHRSEYILQRIYSERWAERWPERWANTWRIWDGVGNFAGGVVVVRGSLDIQEAATLGGLVRTADHFWGGNVGVQQPGKIAER